MASRGDSATHVSLYPDLESQALRIEQGPTTAAYEMQPLGAVNQSYAPMYPAPSVPEYHDHATVVLPSGETAIGFNLTSPGYPTYPIPPDTAPPGYPPVLPYAHPGPSAPYASPDWTAFQVAPIGHPATLSRPKDPEICGGALLTFLFGFLFPPIWCFGWFYVRKRGPERVLALVSLVLVTVLFITGAVFLGLYIATDLRCRWDPAQCPDSDSDPHGAQRGGHADDHTPVTSPLPSTAPTPSPGGQTGQGDGKQGPKGGPGDGDGDGGGRHDHDGIQGGSDDPTATPTPTPTQTPTRTPTPTAEPSPDPSHDGDHHHGGHR